MLKSDQTAYCELLEALKNVVATCAPFSSRGAKYIAEAKIIIAKAEKK